MTWSGLMYQPAWFWEYLLDGNFNDGTIEHNTRELAICDGCHVAKQCIWSSKASIASYADSEKSLLW